MNIGHETQDSDIENQIDRTLRLIGSADPRPGIEKRVTARLAEASVYESVRPFGLARRAFASAIGMAACIAIIAGSVTHSHHIVPIAPGVPLPIGGSAGVGAASAAKAAVRPVAPPAHGRPRSMRKITGATDIQKPDGVAVPRSPMPQGNTKPQ